MRSFRILFCLVFFIAAAIAKKHHPSPRAKAAVQARVQARQERREARAQARKERHEARVQAKKQRHEAHKAHVQQVKQKMKAQAEARKASRKAALANAKTEKERKALIKKFKKENKALEKKRKAAIKKRKAAIKKKKAAIKKKKAAWLKKRKAAIKKRKAAIAKRRKALEKKRKAAIKKRKRFINDMKKLQKKYPWLKLHRHRILPRPRPHPHRPHPKPLKPIIRKPVIIGGKPNPKPVIRKPTTIKVYNPITGVKETIKTNVSNKSNIKNIDKSIRQSSTVNNYQYNTIIKQYVKEAQQKPVTISVPDPSKSTSNSVTMVPVNINLNTLVKSFEKAVANNQNTVAVTTVNGNTVNVPISSVKNTIVQEENKIQVKAEAKAKRAVMKSAVSHTKDGRGISRLIKMMFKKIYNDNSRAAERKAFGRVERRMNLPQGQLYSQYKQGKQFQPINQPQNIPRTYDLSKETEIPDSLRFYINSKYRQQNNPEPKSRSWFSWLFGW